MRAPTKRICGARTFLEITSQIENLATDRWNEQVSNFLLGTIIAAHNDDELSFVCCSWGPEDGACYEMGVNVLGNQVV